MPSPAVQPLLCLLGYPVGGNPTQYLIERVFAQHDLDWRYLTFEVQPENLGDAVRGLRALGFRGGHCVGPHRQAVVPLLDRTTETAALIGSVNLIFRDDEALVGENTEGKGVAEAIRAAIALIPDRAPDTAAESYGPGVPPAPQTPQATTPNASAEAGEANCTAAVTLAAQEQHGLNPGPSPATGEGSCVAGETTATPVRDTAVPCPSPAIAGGTGRGWAVGRRAVLLGAGQLARATAIELAAAGIAGVTIVDRTESRAADLAALLTEKLAVPASSVAWDGDYAVRSDADLLIHATSMGHDEGSPLPLVSESLRAELLVADASGSGTPTWLLREAAAHGCPTVDGLCMFLEQIAIGVRLWTGIDPDRGLLREAAEEFLGL